MEDILFLDIECDQKGVPRDYVAVYGSKANNPFIPQSPTPKLSQSIRSPGLPGRGEIHW